MKAGQGVTWKVNAPAGLTIDSVYVPHMWSYGLNGSTDGGWAGHLLWAGGSGGVPTFTEESGWSSGFAGPPHSAWPAGGSPYFGWKLDCEASTCTTSSPHGDPYHWLSIELLELNTRESVPPSVTGTHSLWSSSGWIRGDWPLGISGDSPSGLCATSASLGGQPVAGASFSFAHNSAYWHQCGTAAAGSPVGGPSSAGPVTVHTADPSYPQGKVSLTVAGADAAGLQAGNSKTLYLDNQSVALDLSGPADAPSTAGTQYIAASASAGPSGVAGIECSLDGSPYQFHGGASMQMAVQGVGVHKASCYAVNHAANASGVLGTSPIQTWTLSIRQPSVSTVSFARVVDALRCAKLRERVRVPARWVIAKYHGRPVRIKLPAERRTVTVVHCHPRIVRRRVRVHGRWRTERVVLLPHTVRDTTKRIRYGAATTISGWIGTTQGNALARQRVRILAAPDNGHGAFQQAAVTTTAADGSWSARIAAGPSRVVQAVYGGRTDVEPSASGPARIVVPALVRMSVSPHHTHWGDRISISGRLRGGYVPPAGELVVLWIGWAGGSTEIGHLYARRDGRFRSTYTFLRGNGTVGYRLWAATVTESDYPYAPGSSPKVPITVGP